MNANLVDINTLSKFFSCDPGIIQLWVKSGMPQEQNKKFDFVQCVKWRIDSLQKENEFIQNEIKDLVVTSEELAKRFNVSVRTIQRWSQSKGLPRIEDDKYPLIKSQDWYIEKLTNDLGKLSTDNPIISEKLKSITLSNLSAIIDIKEKAKQLIPASSVKNVIGYFKSTVNSSLDAYIEDLLTLLKSDISPEKELKIRESYNELKRLLASLSIKDKLVRDEALLDDDFILRTNMEINGSSSIKE